MKRIPYIQPVTFVDHDGKVIQRDGKPVVVTDVGFLLERTFDAGVCGPLKGYQQLVFTEALRKSIIDQAVRAESDGMWELEDAHFDALKAHLADAALVQDMLHNIAPFIRRFFE